MTTHRTVHGVDDEVRAELYHETLLPTTTNPVSAVSPAPAEESHEAPHIVVGTDGSGPAQVAVRWAVDEAVRTRARLTLLRTWQPGESVGTAWLGGTPVREPDPPADELIHEIEAQVDELRRSPKARGLRIDAIVLGGSARDILLEKSKTADLLVVGTRGRGAMRSALMGSVSRQVSARAECPVVVVPAPRPRP